MKIKYDIKDVLKYFYKISEIPRQSGKEEKIADYIEAFAKERKLEYIRDKYNNVVIIKEAIGCTKKDKSIMLQAHLDMVCEKEENSKHNFETDGIDVYIDGDFLKAKETTLGADNGIGIAIILAILDSNTIKHPRIEAVFTVEEESTMNGAQKIDLSMLQSKKMISFDNMNEEELWIGCAGAKIFEYIINGNIVNNKNDKVLLKIELSGFLGGHSGKDISKGRGNPIEEIGKILNILDKKYDILLKNIYGGRKVNVIPRECYCEVYVENKDIPKIKKDIKEYITELKKTIQANFENVEILVYELKNANDDKIYFDSETTKKIIEIINNIPNGVYYVDKYENPLVSLNIGRIEKINENVKLSFSIRSNRMQSELTLIKKLQEIAQKYNIQVNESELSGYEHKNRSAFVDECKKIYKQCFDREPRIIDMHICLEVGFFSMKKSDLDFIAIAPNIYDAHSPKERCSISSLKKIYNYVIIILENL
jgi:dipeptidase D